LSRKREQLILRGEALPLWDEAQEQASLKPAPDKPDETIPLMTKGARQHRDPLPSAFLLTYQLRIKFVHAIVTVICVFFL
jgi:hypothetical protein